MLRIKPGVKLAGLRPEIWAAVDIAEKLFDQHGVDCVITEGMPTVKHGRNSLHNVGLAVDLRSQYLANPSGFADVLRDFLGAPESEFDVVVEPTHIHVEFQPK